MKFQLPFILFTGVHEQHWDVIVFSYPLGNVKIASLCLTETRKVLCGFRDETNSEITNQIRCASCQEVAFAPSCHLKAIWVCIVWSTFRRHGKTWNFRIDFYLYRKCILSIPLAVFLLGFASFHMGQRSCGSGLFSPALISKPQAGVLSCHGAVSLTVTQLTDSQTTHDRRSKDFILFSTCQMNFFSWS